MTVLVFTQRLDPTADLVLTELARREVPVFRCDAADFPTSLSLSARLEQGRWVGELRTELRTVALEEINAVWYRKPSQFQFGPGLTPAELDWATGEARLGLGGVLATLSCRWLSRPEAIMSGAFKPLQLMLAAELGMTTPPTMITNDPAGAEHFATGQDTGVVYKPFGGGPADAERPVRLFTTRVNAAECGESSVVGTAHQFQAWVPKSHEVRVTVVGDRVFAVAIHADTEAGQTDWRSDYDRLAYDVVELPERLRHQCLALVRRLGLAFGCLDFIVDLDGRYVFLEINPNGQWAWIPQLRQPITSAIADYLEGGMSCPTPLTSVRCSSRN